MNEFAILERYLNFPCRNQHVDLSHGDDAAMVSVPADKMLAITTDTLVENRHFLASSPPFEVGYRAVAVNISDLAAMGAQPVWMTLALTLSEADQAWLQAFSSGLRYACQQFEIDLIGGDLTKGPLTITVQAQGWLPSRQYLTRHQAQPGDRIYVTGDLGSAALAVMVMRQQIEMPTMDYKRLLYDYYRPTVCVNQGQQLRDIANSCIDVSDGLLADLGHILSQSQVGAVIDVTRIPIAPLVKYHLPLQRARQLALTGGDDYQLCFSIAPEQESLLQQRAGSFYYQLSCIGEITAENAGQLTLHDEQGNHIAISSSRGYRHFYEQ